MRVVPLPGGAPGGAKAYRILYRSQGARDQPIAVSGAVIFAESTSPRGGRPIVAWAHPTTGVADRCAPSVRPGVAGTIPGLEVMLARGYVVVATDYEGLGTAGEHPYLIGESEARTVLDGVRAARNLRDSGAGQRFAVWGHSQGGHAALFTGQIAKQYAPELELVGIAAAAPPTDLARLFELERGTDSGNHFSALAIYSWSKYFGFPLDGVIARNARGAVQRLAHNCLQSLEDYLLFADDLKALPPDFLAGDPGKSEPWRTMLAKNSAGRRPIPAPMFLSQGEADTTVRPQVTREFLRKMCRAGARIKFMSLGGTSHMFAARASTDAALTWIADRFARKPAQSDCRS